VVRGQPRGALSLLPTPQPGAPCGTIDTLDFPLDPPDGEEARGGGDFGRYRSRYGLYHAGEDWRLRNRSQTLGAAVHSIGHGQVTYAQPLGWGQDKGVVIVRHVTVDGRSFLSFYGHLAPESVTLAVGACVARGDVVGRIGDPRTSPHLHFELRTHMPAEPGRGYSEKDPSLAGWLPPSATIWRQRIAVSPGVAWTLPPAKGGFKGVGAMDKGIFVAVQDDALVALDLRDGHTIWRHEGPVNVYTALLHPDGETLYVAGLLGDVAAYRLAGRGASAPPDDPAWIWHAESTIYPALAPLPGGGVALATRRRLTGISPEGETLWAHEAALWSAEWVLVGDQVVLSGAGGEIWSLDDEGGQAWEARAGGHLAVSRGRVYSYDRAGVHRLDLADRTAALWYALPGGLPGHGDLVALPDGGLLVAHREATTGSLIRLDGRGAVRWRRRYEGLLWGEQRLFGRGGAVYLASAYHTTTTSEMALLYVDLDEAALVRVFEGGSRVPTPADTWTAQAGEGRLLVGIGGTGMALLDPGAARQVVEE
jgi:murein DD-endopeptidase MepM/ murein hydrolase activator NlpD